VTDLVIRPLTAGEEHLFDLLPDPGLVGPAAFGGSYRHRLAAGEYRPQWTWVALRGGTVVACRSAPATESSSRSPGPGWPRAPGTSASSTGVTAAPYSAGRW